MWNLNPPPLFSRSKNIPPLIYLSNLSFPPLLLINPITLISFRYPVASTLFLKFRRCELSSFPLLCSSREMEKDQKGKWGKSNTGRTPPFETVISSHPPLYFIRFFSLLSAQKNKLLFLVLCIIHDLAFSVHTYYARAKL